VEVAEMDIKKLEKIVKRVISKMENSIGVAVFGYERAQFENWFQVELSGAIKEEINSIELVPEKKSNLRKYLDITFSDWAIQLKFLVACYVKRNFNFKIRNKNSADDIGPVIRDMQILNNASDYPNKAIIFVIFPLNEKTKEKWENRQTFKEFRKPIFKYSTEIGFKLENGITGYVYIRYWKS